MNQNPQTLLEHLEELKTFLYPLEVNQIKLAQCLIDIFKANQTEMTQVIHISLETEYQYRFRFDFENEYKIEYRFKEQRQKEPNELLNSLEYINHFFYSIKEHNNYTEEELGDFKSIINYSKLTLFEKDLPKALNILIPQSLIEKCQTILNNKEQALSDRKSEMVNWLEKMKIQNYVIHDDLSIDVNDNVNIARHNLDSFPYAFGVIHGSFDCSYNNLTSLKNGPKIVKGNFDCSSNKIKTLEDSPFCQKNYNCSYNELKTLEGIQPVVNDNLNCVFNKLTSFGSLKTVKRDLVCEDNQLDLAQFYKIDVFDLIHCDELTLPMEYKSQKTNYYEDGVYSVPVKKDIIDGNAMKAYQKGMTLEEYLFIENAKKEKALLESEITTSTSSHKIKL